MPLDGIFISCLHSESTLGPVGPALVPFQLDNCTPFSAFISRMYAIRHLMLDPKLAISSKLGKLLTSLATSQRVTAEHLLHHQKPLLSDFISPNNFQSVFPIIPQIVSSFYNLLSIPLPPKPANHGPRNRQATHQTSDSRVSFPHVCALHRLGLHS